MKISLGMSNSFEEISGLSRSAVFLYFFSLSEKAMASHSSTLAWKIQWAAVHGVTTSRTRLHFHFHFHFSLSCIEEGNGNPLQCSCLQHPRDRGAWWVAIYGVAQSRTRLKQISSSSSCIAGGFFTN